MLDTCVRPRFAALAFEFRFRIGQRQAVAVHVCRNECGAIGFARDRPDVRPTAGEVSSAGRSPLDHVIG